MLTPRRRAATVRRLERATGRLASAAIARMDERFSWYGEMPPENRSWVGLVVQAGITAFIEWFRHPGAQQQITADVFGTAPRELVRAVTLQQTVEFIRVAIEVVEEHVDVVAEAPDAAVLREAVLRYSREIAFAAAQVYAQAAEARGAWDARLEAHVVDTLLRGEIDEGLRSRAAALGWGATESVLVVAGSPPGDDPEAVIDALHRAAHAAELDVLTGVQGDRLIVILGGVNGGGTGRIGGGVTASLAIARTLLAEFGPGPVVVGPLVPSLLAAAQSAQAAVAGLVAAAAWPDAPRPVLADDLLPERALDGDPIARRKLVEEVYVPLVKASAGLLETLSAYLEHSTSLEASARMLYVHPNTVRYRLRRIAEVTGFTPTDRRSALTLHVALALGRLAATRGEL